MYIAILTHLDLLDGARGRHDGANLADVKGVVITVGVGVGILVRGVLPSLCAETKKRTT